MTSPDKHFCSAERPGCPEGLECNGKECVKQGTAVPDTGAPDVATPDSTVDAGAPDVAVPDVAVPDVAVPDVAVPDVAVPDVAVPDVTAPDVLPPDTSVDVGTCTGGETEICYSGAITTLNVGTCKAGTRTCGADGTWGPCAGEVTPVAVELCDTFDDDCDGTVDNACIACIDGETRPCGIDTGACSKGVQTCSSGQWGSCNGSVGPTAEQCDGVDHDCDGDAYNGFECKPGDSGSCTYTGTVAGCSVSSTKSCSSSTCTWTCAKPPEQCDTADHNCDGNPYDGLCEPGKCSTVCPSYQAPCTISTYKWKICGSDCKYPKLCSCYGSKCVN